MRYFIHFVIGLLLIQAPFAESIEASGFETQEQQSRYTQLIEKTTSSNLISTSFILS